MNDTIIEILTLAGLAVLAILPFAAIVFFAVKAAMKKCDIVTSLIGTFLGFGYGIFGICGALGFGVFWAFIDMIAGLDNYTQASAASNIMMGGYVVFFVLVAAVGGLVYAISLVCLIIALVSLKKRKNSKKSEISDNSQEYRDIEISDEQTDCEI